MELKSRPRTVCRHGNSARTAVNAQKGLYVKPLGHMTLTLIPGLPSKPEAPCVVMEV